MISCRLETNPDEMNPVLNPHIFLGPFTMAYPEVVTGAQNGEQANAAPALLSLWAESKTKMQCRSMVHTLDLAEAGRRVAEASDAYWVAKYACKHNPSSELDEIMNGVIRAVETDVLNPMNETHVGAWRNLVSLIYTAKAAIRSQ